MTDCKYYRNARYLWLVKFASFITLLCVLSTNTNNAYAQSPAQVRVDRTTVELGDTITLTIEASLSGRGDIRLTSDLDAAPFIVVGQSSTQPIRMINGTVKSSLVLNYTLRASREGTFNIRPPSLRVGQDNVTFDTIEVTVVAASNRSNTQPGMGSRAPSGNTRNPNAAPRSRQSNTDDVFVEITMTPERAPYVGEQILLDYDLYVDPHNVQVRISPPSEPSLDDFWVENVNTQSIGRRQMQNYGGRLYERTMLRRYAIFPLRSGEARIQGMEVPLTTGGFFQRQRQVTVRTDDVVLDIQPLPDNAPASFRGQTVGQWKFNVTTDTRSTKVGLPIRIRFTASGKGRANNAGLPDLPDIPGARLVNVDTSIENSDIRGTIYGTKTAEYVLMPLEEGVVTIPEIEFSYFDPDAAEYISITSNALVISVDEGQVPANLADPDQNQLPSDGVVEDEQDDSNLLTAELLPLINPTGPAPSPYSSIFFWLALLLPLPAIGFLALPRRLQTAIFARQKVRQHQQALLDTARNAINESRDLPFKRAATYLADALINYLMAAFSVPKNILSSERTNQFIEHLSNFDVPESTSSFVLKTIGRCNEARYAPVNSTTDTQRRDELVDDCFKCIEQLSKFAKHTRPISPAAQAQSAKIAGILLLFTFIMAAGGPQSAEANNNNIESQQLFNQVLQAYQAHDWDSALDLQFKLTTNEARSPAILHYNLGTTYAHTQDFANARLHLEKAQALEPDNPIILHNLNIVRKSLFMAHDSVSEENVRLWKHAAGIHPISFVYAIIVALWMVLLGLIAWRIVKFPRLKPIFTLFIVAGALGILIAGIGGIYHGHILRTTSTAIVMDESLAIYQGPSELAALQSTSENIFSGLMVKILETRPEWIRIEFGEKQIGWVKPNAVKSIQSE